MIMGRKIKKIKQKTRFQNGHQIEWIIAMNKEEKKKKTKHVEEE